MNQYFLSAENVRAPFVGIFLLTFRITFKAADDTDAKAFVDRLFGHARRIPFLSYSSSKWGRAEAAPRDFAEERTEAERG